MTIVAQGVELFGAALFQQLMNVAVRHEFSLPCIDGVLACRVNV